MILRVLILRVALNLTRKESDIVRKNRKVKGILPLEYFETLFLNDHFANIPILFM